MDLLYDKLKEVSLSVLPITLFVLVLSFTLIPIDGDILARFMIGAVFIILGLGIFLFGAEIGIGPIGNLMGKTVAKSNKKRVIIGLGFILGFLITVAEPDLKILADQVMAASGSLLTSNMIVLVVSLGVGVMVVLGLLRILFNFKIHRFYIVIYLVILILGFFVSEEFLAISVDASGATTGAMTTPFILALGYGVSQLKGGKNSEADSFGLVGLASTGPILAVMLMSIVMNVGNIQGEAEQFVTHTGIFAPYLEIFPEIMKEAFITLVPLTVLYLLFNHFNFRLRKFKHYRILKGLLYTFIGLTLFLVGVNAGFMEVGRLMGSGIASLDQTWLLPVLGFVLGMVVVLAEPAVYVLTEQVEEVTAGHINKRIILGTLSISIALAVMLSMLRIMIPGMKLWHFLLPGFGIGLFLSRKVSPLFVGIAFDSGGVASGPMTATFVLAFAQGAASAIPHANVLVDGFGIIAMIAMMPIVAIHILGIIYKRIDEKGVNHEPHKG